MTPEQKKEFLEILNIGMTPRWRSTYVESRILEAMKAAHNAAVRKCAETAENSSHAYIKKNILQNLIDP